jgi:multiple sugar transport system ATP-binding protein
MRAEVSRLQRSLAVTTVYVTHDQIEAMTMGDRVAVMSKGLLQQVDSPQNLYDFPKNLFVAAFIGSPQMNLIRSTLTVTPDGGQLNFGAQSIRIPAATFASRPGLKAYDGKELAVGIRPEHLEDASIEHSDDVIQGVVTIREGLGSEVILHLSTDGHMMTAEGLDHTVAAPDLVSKVEAHTSLRVGDQATLSIDTSQLHFFDLDSTLAITS